MTPDDMTPDDMTLYDMTRDEVEEAQGGRIEAIGYWRPAKVTAEYRKIVERRLAAEVAAGTTRVYGSRARRRPLKAFLARRRQRSARLPDVRKFVDPDWDPTERRLVLDHLVRGTRVNQFRGLSRCRFCVQRNGSAEITDGAYCWPEGLAHYVSDHDVRLPERFVAHVQQSHHGSGDDPPPKFDHLGQRDRAWQPSGTSVWEPKGALPESDGFLMVAADFAPWIRCRHP